MGRKGKRGRSEDDYLMQYPMSAKRFCSQLDAFVESSPVFENFQGGKCFPQGRPMLADAIQDYAFAALQDRPDFIQRIRFQFRHHCQVKDVACGKVGTAMPDFFCNYFRSSFTTVRLNDQSRARDRALARVAG